MKHDDYMIIRVFCEGAHVPSVAASGIMTAAQTAVFWARLVYKRATR